MRLRTPVAMDSGILLDLAASDDVDSFRRLVEEDKLPIDVSSAWYGRWLASSSSMKMTATAMGFEQRTPLMVAALYGSISVLEYILASPVEVNSSCGSDSITALHCAVAGGSVSSLQAVKLLLDAGADVDAVDAAGNRPGDMIPRQKPSSTRTKSTLEILLGGVVSLKDEQESPATPKLTEKKEYPVDATLPDIKSGIYQTDEFRMYTFKVKPCSRAYSHDWTECPFVHPGENARRRDPRKYHYSCVPCPEFRKGSCRNGDSCEYAHGVFESWLHPAQYRTRLCKDETGCNRRVCFFAHKTEELRPLYPAAGSPGSVVSSPRSGINLPPLDLGAAAAALLMNQPLSPNSSTALAAAVWLNQTAGAMTTPTAQLPSSRLKSAVSARDMELDFDLLGLEAYQQLHHQKQQQQLMEEIGNMSLPRSSDYGDLYGSPDSTLISPLKGLSLKQFQSPTPKQKHQNLSQQFLSGYGTGTGVNLPSSPSARTSSSSFALDHSLASAIMNSRASAFAKRSQSFIDRGAVGRPTGGMTLPNSMSTTTPTRSDWGSPNGKLDWGIQGEELNKLRKSASFGFRSNGTAIGSTAAAIPETLTAVTDEPDVSWVQSIVKDGPSSIDQPQQNMKRQFHLNSGAGEFHPGEVFSTWADQLYMAEQEQMVA